MPATLLLGTLVASFGPDSVTVSSLAALEPCAPPVRGAVRNLCTTVRVNAGAPVPSLFLRREWHATFANAVVCGVAATARLRRLAAAHVVMTGDRHASC